ncbi:hypothetical protein PMAYCL1PPCAC_30093, partial [Pristionchus mayeri]
IRPLTRESGQTMHFEGVERVRDSWVVDPSFSSSATTSLLSMANEELHAGGIPSSVASASTTTRHEDSSCIVV